MAVGERLRVGKSLGSHVGPKQCKRGQVSYGCEWCAMLMV